MTKWNFSYYKSFIWLGSVEKSISPCKILLHKNVLIAFLQASKHHTCRRFIRRVIQNHLSSKRICHMIVGGGGVRTPPPPTRLFNTEKLIFSLRNEFFWLFRQSVRSSWVKQSGETYPKNFVSQRENQFFGGKKSCRGWGPNPRPNKQMADFRCCKVRCI